MTRPRPKTDEVRLLQAMGSPVRWRILRRLADDACVVADLVETTGEAQSTVSQHLLVLRQAGLVQCEKRSIWRRYALAPGVASFLDQVLALKTALNPEK